MKFRTIEAFVDRGGTFTDIIVRIITDGERHKPTAVLVKKVLSELGDAARGKNPLTLALSSIYRECCRLYPDDKLSFEEIRIGTTVATNALLERKGEAVVLVTNKGFKDALKIGYQNRPDIFALEIIKSSPLFQEAIEIGGRYSAQGEELTPFDREEAQAALLQARKQGFKSVAINFMHGYKYADHEKACAEIAAEIGFEQISVSSQVNPLIKFVSRGDTTLVDAYLTPALKSYSSQVIKELSEELPFTNQQKAIYFMKSDGGLAHEAEFRGRDALLSGPAGGVVGAVKAAQDNGFKNLVALDMGGTSTDVSYFAGEFERLYETTLAGVRLRAPMLAVHTVAAGGGSILSYDGARFLVGPESAGAMPGPACYGHGGPLTVTDANLILGRISADHFPSTFGADFRSPLDEEAPRRIFAQMQTRLGSENDLETMAWGFLTIAVEKMAQAISKVSTQKGHDVQEAVLVAFGGAGGQHACLIAERLGMRNILLHPLAGVLSASGIGATTISAVREINLGEKLDQTLLDRLPQMAATLAEQARAGLSPHNHRQETARTAQIECALFLRYPGADTNLTVTFSNQSLKAIQDEFQRKHQKLFGFASLEQTLIVEAMMVTASDNIARENDDRSPCAWPSQSQYTPGIPHRLYAAGKWHETILLKRSDLRPGDTISGPMLISEETATTVVEPNWTATMLEDGSLLLKAAQLENPVLQEDELKVDPVKLELFSNIFMSIAEEMGITLQQVSHSVNIKERLDFSCAIFDDQGRLIANAPHIPVHLGSMGDSVKSLIKDQGANLSPGDVYVLNNPYNGGTHLPDITVISPVFINKAGTDRLTDKQTPDFFVASRGHHADIGGISPGSMPPTSQCIDEEGVLINNFQAVAANQFQEDAFIALLESAAYPPRNIKQNIADLKAQIAANNKGLAALSNIVDKYGLSTVRNYMKHVRDNAALAIRAVLPTLKSGEAACTMDDGSTVKVKITIKSDGEPGAIVDFTGTSAQSANNLNSPLAVCRSAVLYVFRTLTKAAIPLNEGCLEPIELIIPPGLLNPSPPAAVVAGNVETSQIIVDTLYRALGIMAASQGTMNNFTFGDQEHQYYETICGGSGAGFDFDGADAVQTHMTNSRLTDPEILESRFPVLLEEFSIRTASGGNGRQRGGNGSRRRIRFRQAMSASILSNRRLIAPPGLAGGQDGLRGRNVLIDADGQETELAATATVNVRAGAAILIETPGGGGFGSL